MSTEPTPPPGPAAASAPVPAPLSGSASAPLSGSASDAAPDAAVRRQPAGAAVLRTEVTEAIRAAVFAELAAVGYGRMSMEGIARRAGVGKAAVYRRWRSKLPLVLDVVSAVAEQGLPAPDTGSLRGDVRAVLGVAARALGHPAVAQVLPDLLAEAARSPELARALRGALRGARGGVVEVVLAQAVRRGEVARDVDAELAFGVLAGPLYWTVAVMGGAPADAELDALASSVAAALRAA